MIHAMSSTLFKFMSVVSAGAIYIVLALFLLFCWYQWRMIRKYGQFRSVRVDVKCLRTIMTGRLPDSIHKNFLLTELLKAAKTFQKEGICTVWHLKPYILVYNHEIIKHLVNEVNLADKASPYQINNLIFGNGLLTSNYEIWKVHRKLINPAFNLSVLKSRIPGLNKSALQLVEDIATLKDKPLGDALHFMQTCASRNMTAHVLGLDTDNENQFELTSEVFDLIDLGAQFFVDRIFRPWLYWNFTLPFFEWGRKYLKMITGADLIVRKIFNEISKNHKNGNTNSEISCGHIIMQLHQDSFLTEKDVRDHILTLATAGYETVYISMEWCLYTLGHHPEVQEIAYNEIQSIVPEGDITFEDLTNLKYLDCVIKETLRMYTTVPLLGRKARKDIQCGEYTIPKGAEVIFFTYMMHRDPNIFPNPEKFDPERFSDTSALRPWMYMPFAEGYRHCIGKKYATMELKVNLAHVLRRFRVTSLNRVDESDLTWEITLKSLKPLRFLFEDRHDEKNSKESRRNSATSQ